MPQPSPPDYDPITDCQIVESIGDGFNHYQFTVDRFDNSNYDGITLTSIASHASTFQDAIEQSPQPSYKNFYFGYSIGGEVWDDYEDYYVSFNEAPTLEIIYKTTIEGALANRYLPIPTSGDMGGTLSIVDHDNASHTHNHIESLDPVELNPGDICTALTDSIEFNGGEFHHHSWESADAECYSVQFANFEVSIYEDEISAYFNDQFQLNLPTSIPEISLKDPWYRPLWPPRLFYSVTFEAF